MEEEHLPVSAPETKEPTKRAAFSRIRGRLMLLMVLVLLPILLVEAYLFYDRFRYRRSVELQSNLEVARAVSKAFETYVQNILQVESAIGLALTSSEAPSAEDRHRMLAGVRAENPAIWDIFWTEPGGVIVASTEPRLAGIDLSDRPYFQEIVAGRNWVVSDLIISRVTWQPFFTISRGFRDGSGVLAGVAVIAVLPEMLDGVLGVDRSGGANVYVADTKGTLVYRYPAVSTGREDGTHFRRNPHLSREALSGKESVDAQVSDLDGEMRIHSFSPIPSLGWVAGAGRLEREVLGPVVAAVWINIVALLCIVFASVAAAFSLSRKIAGSVDTLRTYALSLARGERGGSAKVAGPAELQDLAWAFNKMAEDITSRERERERLFNELEAERHRWKATVENLLDPLTVCDARGRATYMNPAYYRLIGRPVVEDLTLEAHAEYYQIYRADGSLFPVDELPLQKAALTGEEVRNVEVTQRSAGGVEFTAIFNASPLRDSEGRITGAVAVGRDISEQRRAEQALRESMELLRLFVEHAPAALAMFDREMRYLLASRRWLDDYHLEGRDIEGLSHYEVFPEITEHWKAAHRRALAGEVERSEEERFDRADGSVQWLRWEVRPWCGGSGDIGGIVIFTEDITARKAAEDALRESEQRFRRFYESGLLGVFFWNMDGVITACNDKFLEMVGYDREDLEAGRINWIAMTPPEYRAADDASVVELRGFGVNRIPYEKEYICKDGMHAPVLIACALLDESCERGVAFALDLTMLKRAEKERLKLEGWLHQAQKAESLARMAGAIAHNFNNILGAVMGNLEMALFDIPPGSGAEQWVSEAVKASRRAVETSRFMLTYLGQIPGRAEPVDPAAVVRDTCALLKPSLPANVHLKTELPARGDVIMADASYLAQIVTNLVTNAVEAIGEGDGEISVAVRVEAAAEIGGIQVFPVGWEPKAPWYACIAVSDTGCGVDEAILAKIFDPYFSTKFVGRGLGLAIVLGLTRAFDGAVSVDGNPGGGMVFNVFFPLADIPNTGAFG
ncbi:MAG: PAS domain S-box protein [Syntrophobacteraceae bacterium]